MNSVPFMPRRLPNSLDNQNILRKHTSELLLMQFLTLEKNSKASNYIAKYEPATVIPLNCRCQQSSIFTVLCDIHCTL